VLDCGGVLQELARPAQQRDVSASTSMKATDPCWKSTI